MSIYEIFWKLWCKRVILCGISFLWLFWFVFSLFWKTWACLLLSDISNFFCLRILKTLINKTYLWLEGEKVLYFKILLSAIFLLSFFAFRTENQTDLRQLLKCSWEHMLRGQRLAHVNVILYPRFMPKESTIILYSKVSVGTLAIVRWVLCAHLLHCPMLDLTAHPFIEDKQGNRNSCLCN